MAAGPMQAELNRRAGLPPDHVTGYERSGQQPQAMPSWSRTAGALLSQT
jgi:hypothetical protein